ncbi:MAG: DUF362 domain-containing protein [Armatimonadetes bacterium]|nr:DUF362 domain-containing protein [Armatimonadota bacterium]
MPTTVSIVKGHDLAAMLTQSLENLGGIGHFVSPGDVVLIKPNSFVKQVPANGNIAKPELVVALAKLVRDAGASRVIVGERNDDAVLANFADSGIEQVAELLPFGAAEHVTVRIPGAKALQAPVTVPKILLDCDKHITVPVGKTHCGAGVTACLKNAMGLMMGDETRKSHSYGICNVPIDVNTLKWPVLGVVDMTIAQEGHFPGGVGTPVRMDLIVAGGDIVAADATVARLIGHDPREVWLIRNAAARGLGVMDEAEIITVGEKIEEVGCRLTGVEFIPDEFGDQVLWHVDQRCPYCIRDAVSYLRSPAGRKFMDKYGPINVVAGPVSDAGFDESQMTLIIGNCNAWLMDRGIYVQGCPPAVFHISDQVKALGLDGE